MEAAISKLNQEIRILELNIIQSVDTKSIKFKRLMQKIIIA